LDAVTEYPEALVLEVFSSDFVDENRFLKHLGGGKNDPDAVTRYLSLPIASRPDISFFFDREYYWQRYPDMRAADIDPLVHFMRWGVGEKRTPHPMIDIIHILTIDPELLPNPPTIDALHDLLCRDLVDPSPLFSLEFYRSQLDGSDEVKGGLLHHFLDSGMLCGFKPNPSFDPIAYYRWTEGKTFDIRSSLRQFALSGDAPQEATGEPPTEGQAKTLFQAKANALQLFQGKRPLCFEFSGTPDLSIIIVVHNNFALTLLALASLRANCLAPIQLVLIDSGSTDETRQLARYVSGACVLHFDSNIGYVRGCNVGLELASANTVLFLNNDVELANGAVTAAMERLQSDTAIGAVGAKVIRTHGLLQEAGCIIWRNGWTVGYQRGQSPLVPEANFVRDVDFCSAVFLLVRSSLLRDLEGFDDAFAPAYFEDVDLCIRIRDAGYRIVYDPAVVVHHLEYGSSARATEAQERIQAAHEVFYRKHRNRLRFCYTSDSRAQLFARSVNEARGRVLLIEDQLPLRSLGSGFVRSNDIIGCMAGMGYHVTVYPIQRSENNLAAVYADFPDAAEVMHDHSLGDLEQFLKGRRGYFNTIWICRTHNLDLIMPILERGGVDVLGGVQLVLDTEAIAATREAHHRALLGSAEPFDVEAAVKEELRNAYFCQTIVAVNAREAEQIEALGLSGVRVLGHLRPLALTPRCWHERAGLLFIGALPSVDSPNFDALCWFVEDVLSIIEQELGHETRLTVAGFTGSDVDLGRFRDHPRITLRGAFAEMAPLYDAHRVFVAPTRYAAGLPYKVHEAASHGVPVVATELLRRQLGWEDGRDLLVADAADAAGFARQVLALYGSEELWNRIRTGAAERVRVECNRETYDQALVEILHGDRVLSRGYIERDSWLGIRAEPATRSPDS
jgi:GT2 family glycosyltransferase